LNLASGDSRRGLDTYGHLCHWRGRPSANCIWRWCRKGVLSRAGKRVRLRHVRIGGKIFTEAEWLNEFGQSLAARKPTFLPVERQFGQGGFDIDDT